MLRNKIKSLVGKEDSEEASTEAAEEDPEVEVKNIKMMNYIRNQFLARGGWVGSIGLVRGGMLMEQQYSISIGAEDTPVTEPPFAYASEKDVSSALVKVTKKLLDGLEKKAHAWRNVPYKDNATISLEMSIPLGPFSVGLEIEVEVESVLNAMGEKPEPL